MTVKLTYAQAETICAVRSNGVSIGEHFDEARVFPSRNNQDNGHRRTITALVRRGVLPTAPVGVLESTGNIRTVNQPVLTLDVFNAANAIISR